MPTKYNLNRKNISLLNEDYSRLDALKDQMKLKSLTETISMMINIMQEVKLEKNFACKKCGKTFELPQDSDPKKIGLTHIHLGDPNCFGCIGTSYRIKKDTNGTTTANDKKSEQTDTTTKTQREIDEELWKSKNLSESALKMLRINKGYEKDEGDEGEVSESI